MKLLQRFLTYLRGLLWRDRAARAGDRPIAPPRRVEIAEWTEEGGPRPLTWKACHPRTRGIFKAELACPSGHAISLRGHSINSDGVVSPSVVCMAPNCDFHDFVRLRSWTGGALR